ncbi:hypothetical protein SLA2020_282280 [Shorea laevis]
MALVGVIFTGAGITRRGAGGQFGTWLKVLSPNRRLGNGRGWTGSGAEARPPATVRPTQVTGVVRRDAVPVRGGSTMPGWRRAGRLDTPTVSDGGNHGNDRWAQQGNRCWCNGCLHRIPGRCNGENWGRHSVFPNQSKRVLDLKRGAQSRRLSASDEERISSLKEVHLTGEKRGAFIGEEVNASIRPRRDTHDLLGRAIQEMWSSSQASHQ